MADWQDRVIAERTELSVKLTALAVFISRRDPHFEALADEDKALLRDQRNALLEYIEILDARIARFTTDSSCDNRIGMVASNTKDCFRHCVGKRVTGVLFDALPVNCRDLSVGNKTLIFEDGTALTISSNGSFWVELPSDVRQAIEVRQGELEAVQTEIMDVLIAAGGVAA